MTSLDRILSLALLLACVIALYSVWLERGEVDNLHARLDSLDGRVEALKPARAPRKPKATA